MKTKNLLPALWFCTIAICNNTLKAQNTETNHKPEAKTVQVTFAYPIGSNGKGALQYTNNFSFNILYGLNGGVNGAEIGSIINYNKGETKGVQLAGVSNINKGYTSGFLLSGISNTCMDSSNGAFISGLLNYSKLNAKGLQLATVNMSTQEFKGFQLGVFNYANKLKGIQLGVFNYVKEGKKALPIGLFSMVKKGYYELELTATEAIYSNMNYKMGVEKFYTLFKVGYATYKSNPVYSFGLGFGGNIKIAEKQKLSIDLSYNQIVYNNKWENSLNALSKADFNYKYSLCDKLSLLIGPSFNLYITEEKVNGEYGTLNTPYSIYTNESANQKLSIWLGVNAGIAIKL